MKTSVAVMRSLATVAIIAFTIWTVADAEKVSPCCVSVSRSRVVEPLKAFRLQESSPPCIKAVILETEKGHFCIDPRQAWVRKKIEEFRRQQNTTESPTSVSPRLTFSAPQSSTESS
ncbi:eotaxin-like [Colossoma macropomum]|uniref:eotaxin-like n=1 Tax=Colossoma macropomum TaxID=42526 RepID=UPI00186435FF|nr:eotaxin-like [Colossoma macropomum]